MTGGGRATSFVDIRDHAMIRVLTEGVRREELAQQQITDLSENLITRPFVRVVPLKGARDFSEGPLVPLMMTSAQALSAYLRVRRSHKMAKLPALWLGSRNRGPMTGSGVYQMPDRRAEEAGYDPQAVHPHMFRHTFANDWQITIETATWVTMTAAKDPFEPVTDVNSRRHNACNRWEKLCDYGHVCGSLSEVLIAICTKLTT